MIIWIVCLGELYVGPFPSLEAAMEFADRQDGDYAIKAVTAPDNEEYVFK